MIFTTFSTSKLLGLFFGNSWHLLGYNPDEKPFDSFGPGFDCTNILDNIPMPQYLDLIKTYSNYTQPVSRNVENSMRVPLFIFFANNPYRCPELRLFSSFLSLVLLDMSTINKYICIISI